MHCTKRQKCGLGRGWRLGIGSGGLGIGANEERRLKIEERKNTEQFIAKPQAAFPHVSQSPPLQVSQSCSLVPRPFTPAPKHASLERGDKIQKQEIETVNALVTGGSGFLGQYIVEQLVRRGDRVTAFCRRKSYPLEALDVNVFLGDLRDRPAVDDACRGVDTVFHVGGIAGMGGPWRLYRDTNVLGTQNVVDGCLANGVGRLIYTSSPSVTFDGRDQCGINESVPYARRWLGCYAHSKALGEQISLAANGRLGLLTCALRPHLIWGPRDRHLIPTIINAARRGRLRRIGDGTNLVDTIYVENAAAAHLSAADALVPDSPVPGQAYFISQGEPVNCWAWIDELLALAGLPPVRKSVPQPLAYAAGAMWDGIYAAFHWQGDPPMTRFLALQLATSHYFDISRAKRDFGYEPTISVAEGMQRLKGALGIGD